MASIRTFGTNTIKYVNTFELYHTVLELNMQFIAKIWYITVNQEECTTDNTLNYAYHNKSIHPTQPYSISQHMRNELALCPVKNLVRTCHQNQI